MDNSEKVWHDNFLAYMDFIVNHPNYKGLSIAKKEDGTYNWVTTAKTEVGKERIEWADKKATELGYPIESGVYARVMREIHPNKQKVCQICGESLSIYYFYPNKNLLKSLKKKFGYDFEYTQHIVEIVSELLDNGFSEATIKSYLLGKFKIDIMAEKLDINDLLEICEKKCREGSSKMLGPGAMSNFPDRYDGFHTYNRCCREFEDKGRWADNMSTYSKDRRAYEYWSDGNIHAANKFMRSIYFDGTSADHLGPISLGFIHDSHYLRPLDQGLNSTKRDRLLVEDIDSIIEIEKKTEITAMTWYSTKIWNYIKSNYKHTPEKVEEYRLALKQNMTNFMEVLWQIINNTGNNGMTFLIETILKPKFYYFEFSYGFNELGEIINKSKRHKTKAAEQEQDRFIRIAFESVNDYYEKENRNVKVTLDNKDFRLLESICDDIKNKVDYSSVNNKLIQLVNQMQDKLINNL